MGKGFAGGTDRWGASEHEAPAATGALEHEFRPPEGLGTQLIGGETLDHRLVRRRAAPWRASSGDRVESCIEAFERKAVGDDKIARECGAIRHGRAESACVW